MHFLVNLPIRNNKAHIFFEPMCYKTGVLIIMEQDLSLVNWTEDPVPACSANCTMCKLCTQRSRIIWGEGNPKAGIIVILDNPGCREDKEGNAFVCGTRQTLRQAAYAAGLDEMHLYVTYILKCRPLRKYEKETARKACFGHLEQQLQLNTYNIAFCLGDVAVKTFFNDPSASVKNTRGSWHRLRNMAVYTSYHPLAVRRRPNLYSIFAGDWEQVAARSGQYNSSQYQPFS